MMIPIPQAGVYAGVEGISRARDTLESRTSMITAKEGQRLVPLPEVQLSRVHLRGGRHPGRGGGVTPTAHAQLEFEIMGALSVIR